MSLETYRNQIITEVKLAVDAFTTYPLEVEYDNMENLDASQTENPHLCCELQFIDGRQADMADTPVHRVTGMLILTAKVRASKGTLGCYRLLEHFYPRLQGRFVCDCKMMMADFDPPRLVSGWWGTSAIIVFHANRFASATV